MKINKLTLLALVATLVGSFGATAQDTTSPYSRFGYGQLRDNATSAQQQMGGVGYAMSSGRQINVMNPASYAAIDSLTFLFDTGVTLTNLWQKEGDQSLQTTGGGLDYLTMQFPIGKRLGASVGLVPYSSVGYSFGQKLENGSGIRQGEGGLNQLYLGLSGRVFKGFSVGFNMSYLFGTTYNQSTVTSTIGSSTVFTQSMEVRDWHVEIGAQYGFNIDAKNRVTLGVVFSPSKTLLGHTMVTTASIEGSNVIVADTVLYTSLKNKFSLPDTWGAGINWQYDRRLMIEADFTYQNWKNAKFTQLDNFVATQFDNRWKVALGAQYTPALRGGYLKRITYRVGASYNHDYITVMGNNVREFGLSCGFGLPAPGQKTLINLGLEWRNRQAHPTPLLRENYLNVTLGVNFNELWFWQSKIR